MTGVQTCALPIWRKATREKGLQGLQSDSVSGPFWTTARRNDGSDLFNLIGRGRESPICHNCHMCGRYRLSRRKQLVDEYFDTVSDVYEWAPRNNIAPTQPVPVVRQNPKEPTRELSLMRWGLIPSWAKDSSVAAKMINARSETAGTRPAFRDALNSRRCLIPSYGCGDVTTAQAW